MTDRIVQVIVSERNMVRVLQGAKGRPGDEGGKGDPGDDGAPVVVLGQWAPGSYSPLDGVTWTSTAGIGFQSLYIQYSSVPTGQSDIPPDQDPSRWAEIGLTDVSSLGAVWAINQVNHGFTLPGQPVAFDGASNRYILASNQITAPQPVALVRQVLSADEAILQSTGEMPNPDPAVIHPDGSAWVPGQVYYIHSTAGRVTATKPMNPGVSRPYQAVIPALSGTGIVRCGYLADDTNTTSSGALDLLVTQPGHGLSPLRGVYLDTGTGLWTLARADHEDTLATHVVKSVEDADTLVVTLMGLVPGWAGLVTGQWYYQSATTAGQIIVGPPTEVPGEFINVVGMAVSPNVMQVAIFRANQVA